MKKMSNSTNKIIKQQNKTKKKTITKTVQEQRRESNKRMK